MQHLIQKKLNSIKYTNTETNKDLYLIYPKIFDDTNPEFLKIDNKYVGNLIVIDYGKEMEGVFLDKILSLEIDLQFSMFYEKQLVQEVIKKITYNIGNTGADIKTSNENQSDAEILSTSYVDAKYIRRQLQIGGEDLYYIYIYLSIYSDSKEKLIKEIQKVEGIASGMGLKTRRAIFRQRDIFEATMPLLKNNNNIKKYYKRNVLTSGLIGTYPFLSNELCDESGILFGINEFNKSLVMVDRFDSAKYKNSNMCIIGTSGSGKSYFSKLMIARNRYLNVVQYVIDPEREYTKLCNKLGGTIINFDNGKIINVMDIRENSTEGGHGYLQNKINKLNAFFSLIFHDLSQEEKNLLEEKVIKCYNDKGITFDDATLYYKKEDNRFLSNLRFKTSEEMPTLGDLYVLIKKDTKLKKIEKLLKPYVSGSMKFLNGHTNVELTNQLIVADIHDVEESNLSTVMFVITEFFWDKIKVNKSHRKVLYLDEVWRLIGNNEQTANFVYKMFKTIRKYGGAATAITQDINDFFSLDDGKYGKGILNNSSIKTIFQLEENDLNVLRKNMNLSEEEIYKIQNAKRGTCLLYAGSNHICVNVEASQMEHKYISTDREDN